MIKNAHGEFADLQAYVKFLEATTEKQAADLAAKNNRSVSFKISQESGGISAYGLNNRMPVTLYSQQWPRLIEAATGKPLDPASPLGKLIADNGKLLASKDDGDVDTAGTVANLKRSMRRADKTGIVSHPDPKNAKPAA